MTSLKMLVSVQLGVNLTQRINQGDFGDMTKIKTLTLDSNRIDHVDDGSFSDLVSLKALYLRKNKLSNLTSNLFLGLSNLTVLYLCDNNIQFIHDSAFQFLTGLEIVDLGDNDLQQIVHIQPILQLPHIHTISLSCNLFHSFETKDLPQNFSSGLEELYISSPDLKNFSITTPIFPYLHKLELSVHVDDHEQWDIEDKTFLKNVTNLYLNIRLLSFKVTQKVLQSCDSLYHLKLNVLYKEITDKLLSTACLVLPTWSSQCYS